MKAKPKRRRPDQQEGTTELVDARLITPSLEGDPRYPFSPAIFEVGYGLFEPLPKRPDLPPLWSLATSDHPADRAEFCRLLNLFEGSNVLDPTILDIALSIHGGLESPVNSIQLLVDGERHNRRSYVVVAGVRQVLAILLLWCLGVRKEPVFEAQIVQQV